MKNIAVISARSGSKGIKDKNIRLFNGKPLLAYTIDAAKVAGIFDNIIVSTDSQEYADISITWGAEVPFLRSEELANDTASSWDVLREVVNKYKSMGIQFDTVTLLQPTSPLRTSKDIIEGYSIFRDKSANLVVGVCEVDHSPLWANTLPNDCSMKDFISSDVIEMPRQNIPTYYRINGALYIIRVEHLMKSTNIYADNSYASIMCRENSIDIDHEIDFEIAEFLSAKRNKDKKARNLKLR